MNDNIALLPVINIPPTHGEATASVIWLHGLGADGHDFEPVVHQLSLFQRACASRFILPHAPTMPVTINNGMRMPAWFDVQALNWESDWDEVGLQRSCAAVRALIDNEKAQGIPAARIFLAGFSQGGAVALLTGLTYPEKLGGLLGLSTFLPITASHQEHFAKMNYATPIFLAHGDQDPIVDIRYGKKSHDLLQKTHPQVEWHEYAQMMHSVSSTEIADIDAWLARQVRA